MPGGQSCTFRRYLRIHKSNKRIPSVDVQTFVVSNMCELITYIRSKFLSNSQDFIQLVNLVNFCYHVVETEQTVHMLIEVYTVYMYCTAMRKQNVLTIKSENVKENDFSDALITLHTLVMYIVLFQK